MAELPAASVEATASHAVARAQPFGVAGRLHWATVLRGMVVIVQPRQLVWTVLSVFGLTTGQGGALTRFALVPSILALLQPTVMLLSTRYTVADERLVITSGLLRRRTRSVPLDKLQNVDVEQDALGRLLGVCILRADTAGGAGSADVSLQYLSAAAGERLMEALQSSRAGEPTAGPRTVELTVPTPHLVLRGLSDVGLGALFGLLGLLLQFQWQSGLDVVDAAFTWTTRSVSTAGAGEIAAYVGLLLATMVGFWMASVAVTVGRFHGFTLVQTEDSLERRHGLLRRSVATIPIRRIQTLTVARPCLLYRLGYAAVSVSTAGARADTSGAGGTIAPVVPDRDVARVVALAVPGLAFDDQRLRPVDPRARRRAAIRGSIVPIATVTVLAWLTTPWMLLAVPVVVAGAIWAARRWFSRLGWSVDGGFVVVRRGILGLHHRAVGHDRIQSVAVHRSPFQRALGLATLRLSTAGGTGLRIPDLPAEQAVGLGDLLAHRSAATAFVHDGV